MSSREIERLTGILAEKVRLPLGVDYYQPGDSKTPYRIVVGTDHGGISTSLFGDRRTSKSEMLATLRFALAAVRAANPQEGTP